MDRNAVTSYIRDGKAILGIELGSTRIKAVLIGEDHAPIAMGSHGWENRLENGVWTYHLDDVWAGVQDAYRDLARDVMNNYGVEIENLAGMGVSAMMHGYLPFDKDGKQLTEFRTWRNTMTEQAAAELTELFGFNVPQRWSIAHLGQAIIKEEAHLPEIEYLTTLAGYIHWKLTGKKVLGVGEASGMFPIDSEKCDYDQRMVELFDKKIEGRYPWKLRDILPQVLSAGEDAGVLTQEGASLLDTAGKLRAGVPVCPPEGDAGTGMTATNSVGVRTGNISAGTSIFSMVVLEKPLSKVYTEIDMVTTPDGMPVAMVHCNNCTSDINAWAGMLSGFAAAAGREMDMGAIYTTLFNAAMDGEKDCGGVVNVNYLSGEPLTGLDAGRPMMVRLPDSQLTFGNFARSLLSGAVVTLRLGMDILTAENVRIDSLLGHGGFFKTPQVGQKLMAAALNTPVSVMETAGEGGPWGMALLAAYAVRKEEGESLSHYLNNRVFAGSQAQTALPEAEDVAGFAKYTKNFVATLDAQRAAVKEFN
jgi:sugar (pentulose or hexulose) kinase